MKRSDVMIDIISWGLPLLWILEICLLLIKENQETEREKHKKSNETILQVSFIPKSNPYPFRKSNSSQ